MSRGEERKPTGDVLFAERESFSREQNERIEDGAPGDLVVVKRIVEMARADGVFSQYQGARVGIPEGEGPVANEHGEAIVPAFAGGCYDFDICRANRHDVAQLADQVCAVVQSAVPGENGAGSGDVRLRFATRFLSGVEGVVEDADVAL